jgi:ABC-2 type transport system permease protein
MASRASQIVVVGLKETIQVLRDRRALAISLALPVLLLVLFGVGVSLDITRARLIVADRDHTAASRALVRRFVASGYFTIAERAATDAAIDRALETGTAHAALVVPRGYARAVARYEPVAIQLIVDGTDSNTASVVRGHALTLFQETAMDLLQQRLSDVATSRQASHRASDLLPIDFRSRVMYNPNLRSRDYFVPGLIGILITMIGVLLPAISLVREHELGTLEALRVSPLSAWALTIGKLAPYGCISVVNMLLVLAAGHYLFGLSTNGSVAALVLGSLLLLLASLGLGLIISAFATTQQGAMAAAFIGTILPVIYLSDFIFTLRSVPWWLEGVSHLVPARPYLVVIRGVVQKGVGLTTLAAPMLTLAVYAAASLLAGAIATRRRLA